MARIKEEKYQIHFKIDTTAGHKSQYIHYQGCECSALIARAFNAQKRSKMRSFKFRKGLLYWSFFDDEKRPGTRMEIENIPETFVLGYIQLKS